MLEQQRAEFSDTLNMRKLYMWCAEPMTRLKWMAIIVDAAAGLKGGALASCIHSYTSQGDPAVQNFVSRILYEV